MSKNKEMLGIGAIAILAVMLFANSSMNTNDIFAKRYDKSNTQSVAASNDCGTGFTSCSNDINMLQDSDGAAVASSGPDPTQTSSGPSTTENTFNGPVTGGAGGDSSTGTGGSGGTGACGGSGGSGGSGLGGESGGNGFGTCQ